MAAERLIECVPNFSEGRDPLVIEGLAASIRQISEVRLRDHSADRDHHRSVFTFTGPPDSVVAAAMAASGVAVERIDLNRHAGVHPRIGAIDVVPFVPLSDVAMTDCVELSREFAERLWEGLRVPVFLYEHACVHAERRGLEEVRRFALAGGTPDIGEGRHPTAGACAVGARGFLIAWNIWLETDDLALAKGIARAIRFSSGGFPGVKALGLPLDSMGIVQVSINSTDFQATPLDVVFRRVEWLAGEAGVRVRGSELIGMIPRAALASDLRWLNLTPARVL
jgi:glutamate formiminotransferase